MPSGGGGDGVIEQFDEPRGGGEGGVFAFADDGGGDFAGKSFVPVGFEDAGEVAVGVGIEDFRRGNAFGVVHPHVERCINPIGKTAVHLVKLH